jgi:hypothetical protein
MRIVASKASGGGICVHEFAIPAFGAVLKVPAYRDSRTDIHGADLN